MREITLHHDGHGLNESLKITADDEDIAAGWASHRYAVTMDGVEVATIQFQHGPRKEPTSKPGITEGVLLAILIDRLRGFQSGPYSSRQNAINLTKLEECLFWTKDRANERAARGVLGTTQK